MDVVSKSQLRWLPLFVCGVVAVLLLREAAPFDVVPAGCTYLRADQICEVYRQVDGQLDELRLLVRTSTQTPIRVYQGWQRLPTTQERVDEGLLVRVHPLPGVAALTLLGHEGWAVRYRLLVVREWTASQFIKDAYRTWAFQGRPAEAKALLGAVSLGTLSAADEAWARGLQARIAIEGNQIREGERELLVALQRDQEAKLIANEIRDTFRLVELYSRHLSRFEDAERLLDELDKGALRHDPGSRAWLELNRGLVALEQGKLAAVLRHGEAGAAWAARYGDPEAKRELSAMQAEALIRMGRTREGSDLFRGLGDTEPSPCRAAELFLRQGRSQRLQLATNPLSDGVLAPEKPLQRALDIYGRSDEAGCSHRRSMLSVLLEFAEVGLLRRDPIQAQHWLNTFEQQLGPEASAEPNRDLNLQRLHLREQLALQSSLASRDDDEKQRLLNVALGLGVAMKELAQAAKAPATEGEPPVFQEAYWQALIDITEVERQLGRHEKALASCLEADRYLTKHSESLPMGASRGGFFGRHQRGSSLCLALFLELRQLPQAFDWLRAVRIRALLPLLGLLDPSGRPPDHADYDAIRRQLDENARRMNTPSTDQQPELSRRHNKLYEQLMASIEKMASHRQAGAAEPRFRPIAEHEIALICHPALDGGWQCMAAYGTKRRAYRVQQLGKAVAPGKQAADLLEPIAGWLRQAKILRVLPFGDEMRSETDVHLLPFAKDSQLLPLWETGIDVVYALDLPTGYGQSVAGTNRLALLVIDPQERFQVLREAGTEIDTALRRQGWQTWVQIGGEPNFGSWPGQLPARPKVAVGDRLRTLLGQTDLFLYMGHSSDERASSWTRALHTADEAGLLVTDILLLPSVPRWSILLGCRAGNSSEETGGQESLGLAQTLIAKGAEGVISTPRPISAVWATMVARALIQHGLSHAQPNLVDILRRSIATLRQHSPQADPELGALRVVVP